MTKLDVFVYNYLVNLGGRFYKENLDNDVLAWGYDNVDDQIGVVNGHNPIADLQQASEEIGMRQGALVSIVFNTKKDHELFSLPGYRLQQNKVVLIPGGELNASTSKPTSFRIKKINHTTIPKNGIRKAVRSKIARDLNNNYKLQNLFFLAGANMLILLKFNYSGGHTGLVMAVKLEQLTFFEIITNGAVLTPPGIKQVISSAMSITNSALKQIVVIIDKTIAAGIPAKDFVVKENIYYFRRQVQTTTRSLPAVPFSAVLRRKIQYLRSVETVCSLGLPKHHDGPKNWDSLAALACISAAARLKKSSKILDAGGEYYSVFLHHMALQQYAQLYCVNLAFKEKKAISNIQYIPGDITRTTFRANSFKAVTCLSVLEHGVDQQSFFMEMNRIMVRQGILFISVDFWCTAIDTMGQTSYGAPIKIFTKSDILDLIQIAKTYDFQLLEPINLSCSEKVISCDDLNYTFLYLTFRKS